jgi:hypothetical protein
MIFNIKIHGKYFFEIFQSDMKDGIETVQVWSYFSMKKERKFSLINFSHPLTLLKTNTIYIIINFINSIHKKKVDTLPAFELFLVGITGVLVNFTLVNFVATTNQVFSNSSISIHTILVVT